MSTNTNTKDIFFEEEKQLREEQRLSEAAEKKNQLKLSVIEPVATARLTQEFDKKGFEAGIQFFPLTERAKNDENLAIDEQTREKQAEMRTEVNRAAGGVSKNAKLGLKETTHPDGDSLNSRTMLQMSDLLIQQAYNNKLSFNINGQDINLTQGQLHDFAKETAEKEEEKLKNLKQAGAAAEDIRNAERNLKDLNRLAELSDYKKGIMTPDKEEEVQNIFDNNENIAKIVSDYVPENEVIAKMEEINHLRKEGESNNLSQEDIEQQEAQIIKSIPEDQKWYFEERNRQKQNTISEDTNAPLKSTGWDNTPQVTISLNLDDILTRSRNGSVANKSDGSTFETAGNVSPAFQVAAQSSPSTPTETPEIPNIALQDLKTASANNASAYHFKA